MKFRIVYNAWWMFWAAAMVAGPWIWVRAGAMDDRRYRHELQHCYQCKRLGRLKFYSLYIALWFKHGYDNHPYEIEARKHQYDQLTSQERKWFYDKRVVL